MTATTKNVNKIQ